MSFRGAPSLGIGSMIGAGIFALFAATGAVAGPATWAAFVLGGAAAALLVAATRTASAGGLVEAILDGFGAGRVAGVSAWLVYLAAVVAVASTVAAVFGDYAAALVGGGSHRFTTALVVAVVLVNRAGIELGLPVRRLVSAGVLGALAVGVAAMLRELDAAELAPSGYPSAGAIAAAAALACFAYVAFSGGGERALGGSTLLYALVAVGVLGTLTAAQVNRHGVTAVAEAARPALGDAAFTALAVAALVATAGAAHGTLGASSRFTGALADAGLFPAFFAAPHAGLLTTGSVVVVTANLFGPSALAGVGSALALLAFLVAGLAALRRCRETLRSPRLIMVATVATLALLALLLHQLWRTAPDTLTGVVLAVILGFVLDYWTSVQHPRDDIPRGYHAAPES